MDAEPGDVWADAVIGSADAAADAPTDADGFSDASLDGRFDAVDAD